MKVRREVTRGSVSVWAFLLIGSWVFTQPMSSIEENMLSERSPAPCRSLVVQGGASQGEIFTKKGRILSPPVADDSAQCSQQEQVNRPLYTEMYPQGTSLWKQCCGIGVVACACIFLYSHHRFYKQLRLISEHLEKHDGGFCFLQANTGNVKGFTDGIEGFTDGVEGSMAFLSEKNVPVKGETQVGIREGVQYIKKVLGVDEHDLRLGKAYEYVEAHEWDGLQKLLERELNYVLLYTFDSLAPREGNPCLARLMADKCEFMSEKQVNKFLVLIKKAGNYVPEAFDDLEKLVGIVEKSGDMERGRDPKRSNPSK